MKVSDSHAFAIWATIAVLKYSGKAIELNRTKYIIYKIDSRKGTMVNAVQNHKLSTKFTCYMDCSWSRLKQWCPLSSCHKSHSYHHNLILSCWKTSHEEQALLLPTPLFPKFVMYIGDVTLGNTGIPSPQMEDQERKPG